MAAYGDKSKGNPSVIKDAKLAMQPWHKNRFSSLTSYSSIGEDGGKDFLTNANDSIDGGGAVHMHTDLLKGGNSISVPTDKLLPEKFLDGDQEITGEEVSMGTVWQDVRISQVRTPVSVKDGNEDYHFNKKIAEKQRNSAKEKLAHHFATYNETYGLYNTIYNGYSKNVINRYSLTAVSHRNFYTANTSTNLLTQVVGTGYGTSTYEQAVGAAVNAVSNNARNALTYGHALKLRELAAIHKIEPIQVKGMDAYHVMLVPPAIANQMRVDTAYKAACNSAEKLGKNSQFFTGAVAEVAGIVFVEDLMMPDLSVAGSDPYTPVYNLNWRTVGTASRKPCVLLGRGAINAAIGSYLNFETEVRDAKAKEILVGDAIFGMQRADYTENAVTGAKYAAGEFSENTSSLIAVFDTTAA